MEDYTYTDESTVAMIADQQPRALSAYFICLHNADNNGFVTFSRDFIMNTTIKSWTKFKNDIRALSRLLLLTFLDQGHTMHVELIQPEGMHASSML